MTYYFFLKKKLKLKFLGHFIYTCSAIGINNTFIIFSILNLIWLEKTFATEKKDGNFVAKHLLLKIIIYNEFFFS